MNVRAVGEKEQYIVAVSSPPSLWPPFPFIPRSKLQKLPQRNLHQCFLLFWYQTGDLEHQLWSQMGKSLANLWALDGVLGDGPVLFQVKMGLLASHGGFCVVRDTGGRPE